MNQIVKCHVSRIVEPDMGSTAGANAEGGTHVFFLIGMVVIYG